MLALFRAINLQLRYWNSSKYNLLQKSIFFPCPNTCGDQLLPGLAKSGQICLADYPRWKEPHDSRNNRPSHLVARLWWCRCWNFGSSFSLRCWYFSALVIHPHCFCESVKAPIQIPAIKNHHISSLFHSIFFTIILTKLFSLESFTLHLFCFSPNSFFFVIVIVACVLFWISL